MSIYKEIGINTARQYKILGVVILLTFLAWNTANAQVGIGTTTPDASAILEVDVSSLTEKKGFLPPRMSEADREANITNPAEGLMIYNTDANCLQWWNGSFWHDAFHTLTLQVFAQTKYPINQDVFGINNDWSKISSSNFNQAMTLFKSMNDDDFVLLRFPGGWESEHFDWDSQTTPNWNNAPSEDGANITQVKQNTSAHTIVVPTRSALLEEYNTQAWIDEVELLKLEAVNAINQSNPSQVKVVEIGNEWWLQWAGGKTREEKLITYGKTAMEMAAHIDNEFPNRNFKLLINGDYTQPQEFIALKNQFTSTSAYNAIDGLGLHTYAGYNSETYNIADLENRIKTCASNFNDSKSMFIYVSEWMPSKLYNNNKKHMQTANIIPHMIHIYAKAGVDMGAYWPPVNSSAPGVGLTNWNFTTLLPIGQILGQLKNDFKTYTVETTSSETIHLTTGGENDNEMVLYLAGGESETTDVQIIVHGFSINTVVEAHRLRPADYNNTELGVPYIEEVVEVGHTGNKIFLTINKQGKYEIIRVVLSSS